MNFAKAVDNQIETSVEMRLPDYVSPAEVFRMQWASSGADWGYFFIEFLRGRRRLDVQPEEIKHTQLWLRSDDLEKRALEMVCATEHELHPNPEDERILRSRDSFLMDFIDGRNLGHADLVTQVMSIPARVAERERFDRNTFPTVYESPRLFGWIFEGK
jgi:hypothetical protein